jgi:hypothetical protein
MATTASFTDVGVGPLLGLAVGDTFDYVVSSTFDGTWVLESSNSSGASWTQVATGTAAGTGTVIVEGHDKYYRFRCSVYTSGTITTRMAVKADSAVVASGAGAVVEALAPYVRAVESGDVVKQTLLTLTDLPQALPNATQYVGTKLYDFPEGRILVLGVTATLQETTRSAIASTLNGGKTGAASLGTATASSTTLNSTMADLLPSTAWVSSATIDVAGTAVTGALEASAHFDGTGTAKDLYLNAAVVTDGDVDADADISWSGSIRITWINLGDL